MFANFSFGEAEEAVFIAFALERPSDEVDGAYFTESFFDSWRLVLLKEGVDGDFPDALREVDAILIRVSLVVIVERDVLRENQSESAHRDVC